VGGQKCKKIEEQKTKPALVRHEIFHARIPERKSKKRSEELIE
jgi:hypothetical protein